MKPLSKKAVFFAGFLLGAGLVAVLPRKHVTHDSVFTTAFNKHFESCMANVPASDSPAYRAVFDDCARTAYSLASEEK